MSKRLWYYDPVTKKYERDFLEEYREEQMVKWYRALMDGSSKNALTGKSYLAECENRGVEPHLIMVRGI